MISEKIELPQYQDMVSPVIKGGERFVWGYHLKALLLISKNELFSLKND